MPARKEGGIFECMAQAVKILTVHVASGVRQAGGPGSILTAPGRGRAAERLLPFLGAVAQRGRQLDTSLSYCTESVYKLPEHPLSCCLCTRNNMLYAALLLSCSQWFWYSGCLPVRIRRLLREYIRMDVEERPRKENWFENVFAAFRVSPFLSYALIQSLFPLFETPLEHLTWGAV